MINPFELRVAEEGFKDVYRKHIAAHERWRENGGPEPSRVHLDELCDELGSAADQLAYEVEKELGLPAVDPKKGN